LELKTKSRSQKLILDRIYNADCLVRLKKIPDESIDLIITSPPYANRRTRSNGGMSVKTYVEWFLPISLELKRILKPRGSFILNIKEPALHGERETYVIELILKMKIQGWLWTEEYIWHKRNSFPGKWPNRFRDAWERCLHFTKNKKFNMYQDNVMVPMGNWAKNRLTKDYSYDKVRNPKNISNRFSRKVSNWKSRKKAYPSNVLHMSTECTNVNHNAAFPLPLPIWFIELFTEKNDVILDPFMGSGTTALAAKKLNRHYVGMELKKEYYKYALKRINNNSLP